MNLGHFRHLHACSTALGLDFGDKVRCLWSYYASRLPGANREAAKCVQISIRNERDKSLTCAAFSSLGGKIGWAAAGAEDGQTRFGLSADPRQHPGQNFLETIELEVKSVPSLMQLMG